MQNSIKHIVLLDYFRGVAIVTVCLFHTFFFLFSIDGLDWNGLFRNFSNQDAVFYYLPLSFLQAGVPIFFVVSGFCIHLSFQRQEQRWVGFFTRRFFRIYPAYLVALIFSILLLNTHYPYFGLQSKSLWVQLLAHAFLIHNFSPLTIAAINVPFWSLAIEAQLYLLYPVLLWLVCRSGWRRAMMILAGCEVLIRGTDSWMQVMAGAGPDEGNFSWLLSRSPFGYWFSWALGAFIADGVLQDKPITFTKIPPLGWLALAVISNFFKPLYPFQFLFFAVMTAVYAGRHFGTPQPESQVRSLPLALLGKVGLWSYSIYLVHMPLLRLFSYSFSWVVPTEFHDLPLAAGFLLASWFVIIPFCVLWYELFELPGIALGKQLIQKLNFRAGARIETENPPGNVRAPIVKRRYYWMTGSFILLVIGIFLAGDRSFPQHPFVNNNTAWSLATSVDPTKRNGALAVKLAEEACQQTQYKETVMIGTLAAAYAEAGRFDDAISAAERACEHAKSNGETNLFLKNQELLQLFLKHQPYREQTNTKN